MSVPSQRFAFEGAVSPGGTFPPIGGVPLDEPSPGDVGIGGSAADWTLVTKRLDESLTSNIVPQNDDALFFPMAANVLYEGDVSLIPFSTSSTPDFKWLFQADAGTLSGEYHLITRTGLQAGNAMTTTLVEALTANGLHLMRIWFLARNSGNSVFRLQWSQNISSGTALTLKAGSRFRYRRLT